MLPQHIADSPLSDLSDNAYAVQLIIDGTKAQPSKLLLQDIPKNICRTLYGVIQQRINLITCSTTIWLHSSVAAMLPSSCSATCSGLHS